MVAMVAMVVMVVMMATVTVTMDTVMNPKTMAMAAMVMTTAMLMVMDVNQVVRVKLVCRETVEKQVTCREVPSIFWSFHFKQTHQTNFVSAAP